MNLFSWINELFVGKRDWDSFSDEDKKKFSPFMVNRYLSMNDDFLPLVNYIQKYAIEIMPRKSVYQFYCKLLPKKKTYLKYILWLNLALGFHNLYMYVNNDSLFNFAIGALNIGVWVFYRSKVK